MWNATAREASSRFAWASNEGGVAASGTIASPPASSRGGQASAFSTHCLSWLLGAAPTFWATGWPSLNRIRVGMPRTP
jgi:hypothetical protein